MVKGESPYVVGGGQDSSSVKEDLDYLVEKVKMRMRKIMMEEEHENEHKLDHDMTLGTTSMTL